MASAKTWYDYFKESCDSCGAPAPTTFFGGFDGAVSFLSACLTALRTFAWKGGATMTVGEMFSYLGVAGTAGTGLAAGAAAELMIAYQAAKASWMVGVWVGAVAYATGQCGGQRDIPGVTSGMRKGWEWWYGVPEKEAEYARLQARLKAMKADKAVAQIQQQEASQGISVRNVAK